MESYSSYSFDQKPVPFDSSSLSMSGDLWRSRTQLQNTDQEQPTLESVLHLFGPTDILHSPPYMAGSPTHSATSSSESPLPCSPEPVLDVAPRAPPTSASTSTSHLTEPQATAKMQPFIAKLSFLLSREEDYSDVIRWDVTGETFIVAHASPRFRNDLLPKFFSHSNPTSFTRQLNVYNFSRVPPSELLERIDMNGIDSFSQVSAWRHPIFFRDASKASLAAMNPRPSRNRERPTAASSLSKKSSSKKR